MVEMEGRAGLEAGARELFTSVQELKPGVDESFQGEGQREKSREVTVHLMGSIHTKKELT